MKKIVAKCLALLMILNIGLVKVSYAVPQGPIPILENTTATQASFSLISNSTGTLYYLVTPTDTPAPTPESVKSQALAGTLSANAIATGSLAVRSANPAMFEVNGLTGKNYVLYTTTEGAGALGPITTLSFTALGYETAPTVRLSKVDQLIVTSKLNTSGILYYGVYTDAAGITAEEVIDTANMNNAKKVYGGVSQETNGVELTTILSNLKGNTVYDIVFAKKDLFGNVSQSMERIDNAATVGNQLVNVVYTKGSNPYDMIDDRIYLYFKENVTNPGGINNYSLSFVDESVTARLPGFVFNSSNPYFSIVGTVGNRVEISIDPAAQNNGFNSSRFVQGHLEATVINGGAFEPSVAANSNTASFSVPSALMSGLNQSRTMTQAVYSASGIKGPEGDFITISTDTGNFSPSLSAAQFALTVGESAAAMPLSLIPITDFTLSQTADKQFVINFTTAGASKLEALPSRVIKVTRLAPTEPPMINPFVTSIYVLRRSSVSTLSPLSVESYTVTTILSAAETQVQVVAADGTTSDYIVPRSQTTTTPPVIPAVVVTPKPVTDPAGQLSEYVLPTGPVNDAVIVASTETLVGILDAIANDQQAYSTLIQADDLMADIGAAIKANPEKADRLIQMVTQILYKIEEKIVLIDYPINQVTVLEQLLKEVKILKNQLGIAMPTWDKAIEDMVQRTADALGTLKIEAPVKEDILRFETKELTFTIERQLEALKKLTQIEKTYFDTSVTRLLRKDIRVEVKPQKNQVLLRVEFTPGQIKLIKDAKVDTLTVSNLSTALKVPVSNLSNADVVQFVIEKRDPQLTQSPSGVDRASLSYDISLLVNKIKREKFTKPITLTFDLRSFALEKESPMALAIFKLNVAKTMWEPVGGIVDPQSKQIYVTRDTLSQYTVLKSKKSFSDADTSWAKAEINAMLNKGIITEGGKFKPQSVLTRGEFAKWIAKAYGLKVSTKSLPFKDVPKGGDAYEAIAAVYQQGLLNGKSKTSFDPNGAVSQNEMAVTLGKLMVAFNNKEKTPKVTSKYLGKLKTVQVASWASDDMALLMELGMVVTSKSGKDAVTKEAAASAFMKFYAS